MNIEVTVDQLKRFTLEKGEKYRFTKYRETGAVEEEFTGIVVGNYDRYVSVETTHGLRDSLLKIDLLGKNYQYKKVNKKNRRR